MPSTASPCSKPRRATAYEANGDESRWLLNKMQGGKPDQIQFYANSFQEKAEKDRGDSQPFEWFGIAC